MVLVDTSVWVRFLSNRGPYAAGLHRLLGDGAVAGHELVYGELLIGAPGGRAKLLERYEQMFQAVMVPHEEVVDFVHNHRLYGRGVGWVDIHLLASAIVGRMKLWTADSRLHKVAAEFGVAFQAPSS